MSTCFNEADDSKYFICSNCNLDFALYNFEREYYI